LDDNLWERFIQKNLSLLKTHINWLENFYFVQIQLKKGSFERAQQTDYDD
jgi:hypothetical protein